MTILLEEQKRLFREMIKKSENETILKCVECGRRLRGMKQVRVHVDTHKHHIYEKPGSTMRLCVG